MYCHTFRAQFYTHACTVYACKKKSMHFISLWRLRDKNYDYGRVPDVVSHLSGMVIYVYYPSLYISMMYVFMYECDM